MEAPPLIKNLCSESEVIEKTMLMGQMVKKLKLEREHEEISYICFK
jgi:hypothetical protein